MDIKQTFLSLTTKTYPFGHEEGLYHLLPELDTDEFGNLYKEIGHEPSTMFTSHLDTATSALTKVNHVFDGNMIKTDGKSILGADDKAGVTLMLYMMEKNVPGLYYFFLGEEVGCIGSKKLSNKHKTEPITYIKKVISFDRRGTDSVITYQSYVRCCSDTFGDALASELNKAGAKIGGDNIFEYKLDPTGVYTDSAQFTDIYPECTNLSVGYYSEHTFNERQDIVHLVKLAKALVLVDFESLPFERDPSKIEYKSYNNYSTKSEWGEWDYNYKGFKGYKKKELEKTWFLDSHFDNYVSYVILNDNSILIDVDFCLDRLNYEIVLIQEFMSSIDINYKSVTWNGFELTTKYKTVKETVCNRNELALFVPELDFWKEDMNNKVNYDI